MKFVRTMIVQNALQNSFWRNLTVYQPDYNTITANARENLERLGEEQVYHTELFIILNLISCEWIYNSAVEYMYHISYYFERRKLRQYLNINRKDISILALYKTLCIKFILYLSALASWFISSCQNFHLFVSEIDWR